MGAAGFWQEDERWVSWDEAAQHAQDLNNRKFAGFYDWRLPNEIEALTLMDKEKNNFDKYGKEIFLFDIFPAGPLATIWTADGVGNDSTTVNFETGEVGTLYKSKSGRMAARPVRGRALDENSPGVEDTKL